MKLNFRKDDVSNLIKISEFFKELHLADIHVVGGAVRDLIIGIDYKDLDLTNGLGGQSFVGGLFYAVDNDFKFRVIEKGVVTVYPEIGSSIDFSSGFKEFDQGQILPEFKSRDFTINSILYNVSEDKISDPNGGIEDIKKGLIRNIYDTKNTFQTFPVRMFKVLELSSKTGFRIDDSIISFFKDNRHFFEYTMNKNMPYYLNCVSKAIDFNEDVFLKNVNDLGIFSILPLKGSYKELLIRHKLINRYLNEHI